MSIKKDVLQEICTVAKLQIQDLYPEFRPLFVLHEPGTFRDVVETRDYELPKHPASETAHSILQKFAHRDESSFLGLAISQKRKWFGLSATDYLMGVFNINLDEFSGARDFRRGLYHNLWQAIDLIEVRKRPEFSGKFKSGPMIPKRSPMNLARLHLQADAFASTMCSLLGERDAIDVLATKRAMDSLTPAGHRKTEDYPFAIALDTMQYAYAEVIKEKPSKTKYMHHARQLAINVGKAFDDSNIRQWWGFAEPAQEMAWRNFSPETILGCAAYTSEDPYIRSIALLMSDITGKDPLKVGEEYSDFNAFAKEQNTQTLHSEMMERAFEDAVARGMYEESGEPLIMAANKQNEDLSNGLFLGWCANALQAAARAFDSALKSGAPPAQAARLEFEGGKNNPEFEDIREIGRTAMEGRRKGNANTLANLAELCAHNPAFAPVLASVKMTLKDPGFLKKLETANDLAPKIAAPARAAAPKAPAPRAATPTQAPTFSAPGLGGNAARSARIQSARQSAVGTDKTAETKDTDKNG
jgi:hypothetical protein